MFRDKQTERHFTETHHNMYIQHHLFPSLSQANGGSGCQRRNSILSLWMQASLLEWNYDNDDDNNNDNDDDNNDDSNNGNREITKNDKNDRSYEID